MKNIKEKLFQFRDDRDWKQFHTPDNLAKSISIEAGELLECFQWNPHYDLQAVKEELADVMMYCLLMGDCLDLDLEEVMLEKLKKNELKYPVELAKGSSEKYTKLKKSLKQ